ncbi:MAG: DEAD/DEAH box helicase [Pseudomonadota bacterium]
MGREPAGRKCRGSHLTQFNDLGLSPAILKTIEKLGFDAPTPIQREAIPHVMRGRDLMGLAQTGTGKTAAFGLPLVQQLLDTHERPAPKAVRALILAPTRELVNQIAENLRAYVQGTKLRVVTVVGGASINVQRQNLQRGTDVLVATPGRLLDLLDRRSVTIDTAKFLILDEADQMLDLGFIHALRKIAGLVGQPRQTLLFSATMPKQIEELSRAYLESPVRVEVAPPGKAADKVRQSVHFHGDQNKLDLLKQCLADRPNALSLVFARTKHGAEKVMKSLVAAGFQAASIHGNKSQGQRERALKAFRNGEVRVLVATDVAARGIDIPGVTHVYNFDLPEVAESYIHRIGRTARAGADGEAIAFSDAGDVHLLRAIEKLMGREVPVASGMRPAEDPSQRRGRGGRNGGRAGGGRNAGGARPARNQAGAPRRGKPRKPKSAADSTVGQPAGAKPKRPAKSGAPGGGQNRRRRRPRKAAMA